MTHILNGRRDAFETSSGNVIYLREPERSVITIEDIARSLARQCRFAGHLKDSVDHYSVAQHSVLVSQWCPGSIALVGLLHDAHEAYTQDLIRPVQDTIRSEEWDALKRAWALRIGQLFELGGLLADLPSLVRDADMRALETERRDLRVNYSRGQHTPFVQPIVPMAARDAYQAFLGRFRRLQEARGFACD